MITRGHSCGQSFRIELAHRDADAFIFGGLLGGLVTGVGVAGYTQAWIVVEDSGDFAGGQLGSISDGDLAGVERVTHAYSAAVMEADPGGAGGGVEQRVKDGPVS